MFRSFGFLAPKDIICFSNLLIVSVPDEVYSRITSWELYCISTFLFISFAYHNNKNLYSTRFTSIYV